MSKTSVGMIEQLGHEITEAAGQEVSNRVMEGAGGITAKTKSPVIALWLKDAMDRLDEQADEGIRIKAMTACGLNCSKVNHIAIDRGKVRREKFNSEEDFLAAEMAKPSAGTRMERDGGILYQIYTPANFRRGMRCFCSLMFGLPEGVTASRTYCNCSRAFVTAYWQAVLGRPVAVEVLETAISGGSECRFKISL
ncbi:MAG: hypothetical protein AB9891_14050 [Anaerolineaceae bacterium]